jgi:hypothetical protein
VIFETPEQQKLRADLIAQYGNAAFERALQLSGLQLCITGLGADHLSTKERERLVRQAGIHLAELIDDLMPSAFESAKVVECARRIDAAIEVWMLDEVEQRDGLPPAR